MVIYADIVFLINFVMDTFIFYLTSIIIRKKVSKKGIILGGFLGSLLYSLLMFYPPLHKFYTPITSMVTIIIPLFIVLRPKNLKEFLKYFVTINICAFFIGGVSTAFFYYTNANKYIGDLLEYTVDDFSIKLLIFASSFTFICIKIYRLILYNKVQKRQHIVDVELENLSFKALLDTGHELIEPLSKSHVIILEFDKAKDFLPDEIKLLFYEKNENDTDLLYKALENTEDISFINSFRLIPFKSIGEQNGNLIAFRRDNIKIHDENKTILVETAFIAVANFSLSSSNTYNALINPKMMTEEF